ncbi:hypothetical protein C8Q77DRAFT_326788 [Trametes polyzona]|nr:hypothetical protein C8Q77DRAFT_326788 [Trametes polyzona]
MYNGPPGCQSCRRCCATLHPGPPFGAPGSRPKIIMQLPKHTATEPPRPARILLVATPARPPTRSATPAFACWGSSEDVGCGLSDSQTCAARSRASKHSVQDEAFRKSPTCYIPRMFLSRRGVRRRAVARARLRLRLHMGTICLGCTGGYWSRGAGITLVGSAKTQVDRYPPTSCLRTSYGGPGFVLNDSDWRVCRHQAVVALHGLGASCRASLDMEEQRRDHRGA